jgi:hypothetical protein
MIGKDVELELCICFTLSKTCPTSNMTNVSILSIFCDNL